MIIKQMEMCALGSGDYLRVKIEIWASLEVRIEATEVNEFLARDCREKKEDRKIKVKCGYHKVSNSLEFGC